MINKYRNIAIIYGGSGKTCALRMEQELKRLHLDEFYPIKPYILANKILSSSSIIEVVKNVISSSSACVVILTFDDVNNTRVRQNVLVEIGIALTIIDSDNCFFISEKEQLPDDFPSDLKNMINPNYFDKNNVDLIVKNTCDELLKHLKIKNYKEILKDNNYIYDYKRVLDDIPLHIFEEKADVQLEHILNEWENNIRSFEFVVERIMYLIERIKFFPDFTSNERFFKFLNNVETLIKPTERDYEFYDIHYLINACNFVNDILKYTKIKLDKKVISYLSSPESHSQELKKYQLEFRDIADNIKEFIINFEENRFEYNWIIKIMAYEYVALAYMKFIASLDKYDESILEYMEYIISCYENVIRIGKQFDPYSNILWQGYAQYDLTRAYENMYRITNDKKYLKKIEEFSQKSIITRYQWFSDNSFKGVFSSALSFEYFLVYKYEYELRYKINEYSSDSTDDILDGLDDLEKELNRYCESTGLGRLYDMRDAIDTLKIKVTNVRENN